MKKFLRFIYEAIFDLLLCIILIVCANNITAKPAHSENLSGSTELTGVKYETIYVGGSRFLIFSNQTGSDIEVFAY